MRRLRANCGLVFLRGGNLHDYLYEQRRGGKFRRGENGRFCGYSRSTRKYGFENYLSGLERNRRGRPRGGKSGGVWIGYDLLCYLVGTFRYGKYLQCHALEGERRNSSGRRSGRSVSGYGDHSRRDALYRRYRDESNGSRHVGGYISVCVRGSDWRQRTRIPGRRRHNGKRRFWNSVGFTS